MPNIELLLTDFEDVDNIMTWVNDPEVTAYFATMGNITRTRDQEIAYLSTMLASKNDRLLSIFIDDEYAGQCSINQIHWPAFTGRFFMVLTKEFQGRGLAPKVIFQLLKVALEDMGLNKIWLIVREDNEKGRHLYKKCGFETEGVLREEYKIDDEFINMVRMAILAKEYRRWYKR
ncbi:GNAT family N-acetyltransferase [Candidatus Kuenenbacteria bacterium]|nr:GNAT family N-acetyltransferase [Candidatus Kuenenbacteria bacterium]